MKLFLVLSVAVFASTGPALAQRDDGQYGRPLQTPENQARFALIGSSFCAYKNASATANKILSSTVGSAEEAKLVKSLRAVSRSCYQPQWPAFLPTEVHNALAQIAYRERFRSAPAPTLPGTTPPVTFGVVPSGTQGTIEQESAWYLAAVANCVVFVDALTAHNLVIGPGGVPEEERRFAALKPALAQCQSASGIRDMKASVVRGYLAAALLAKRQSGAAE